MFSGIVQECGKVVRLEKSESLLRIVIASDLVIKNKKIGDSIAVNGVCLTVVELNGNEISFQAIQETLDLTNLGNLEVGGMVNLESALRLADTIDGHLVQGHVDGVAKLDEIKKDGDVVWYWFHVPRDLLKFIAYKGSICFNGVSLTVAGVNDDKIGVSLIPHTLKVTNLGILEAGDHVNVEVDMLARYMERLLIK